MRVWFEREYLKFLCTCFLRLRLLEFSRSHPHFPFSVGKLWHESNRTSIQSCRPWHLKNIYQEIVILATFNYIWWHAIKFWWFFVFRSFKDWRTICTVCASLFFIFHSLDLILIQQHPCWNLLFRSMPK